MEGGSPPPSGGELELAADEKVGAEVAEVGGLRCNKRSPI